MANHKSAEKCIRKTARRTEINRNRISRVRTFVKKAEAAVGFKEAPQATSSAEAMLAVVAAESQLMKAASKGTISKKAASRKISRLVKRAKAIA